MKGDKADRMARVVKVHYILSNNPKGIPPERIADQCDVTIRTIYRDRRALEAIIGPIWTEKGKWMIEPGNFLPPISFTVLEAMTIFIAARLLLGYGNTYNPSIASTLMRLNSIVPLPLRDQIRSTIERMERQGTDQRFLHALETLSRAWMEGRRAKIWYWTFGKEEPTERVIEPYYIQPAALEHANYVIAYCHRTDSIRTFKIERIRTVELLDERYTAPEDFDANEYLGSAWGITVAGKVETVKLRFNPQIARIAEETTWHPSQVTQRELGGAAIVTMKLPITVELEAFILGWGEKVEVMEPKRFRQQVARAAQAISDIYKKK